MVKQCPLPPEAALKKAIAIIGGPTKTSNQFGITQAAVCQWKVSPAHRAIELERLSGVSRHELRPDVFGPAP